MKNSCEWTDGHDAKAIVCAYTVCGAGFFFVISAVIAFYVSVVLKIKET